MNLYEVIAHSSETFSAMGDKSVGTFFPVIERLSYNLEMKAREQNRNDERTEIERFDWFIERKDKRVCLFIG